MSDKKTIIGIVWSTAGIYTIGFAAIKTLKGWKAYMHLSPGVNEEYDAHHIANFGAKMNVDQACGFFPNFKKEDYDK